MKALSTLGVILALIPACPLAPVFAAHDGPTEPLHFVGAPLGAGAPKRRVSAFGVDALPGRSPSLFRVNTAGPYKACPPWRDSSLEPSAPFLSLSNLERLTSNLQDQRPGVAQGGPPATFSITRHGKIIFEADVREPGSSRVSLTETVEISGVKSKSAWTPFVSAFVDSTSRAWLSDIPPSAAAKKGKVVVAFALRHDGSIEGTLSIARSSGDSSIDDATRLAIAKSAPFRELPSAFRAAAAQFRVTFAFNHPHILAPAPSSVLGTGVFPRPAASRVSPFM